MKYILMLFIIIPMCGCSWTPFSSKSESKYIFPNNLKLIEHEKIIFVNSSSFGESIEESKKIVRIVMFNDHNKYSCSGTAFFVNKNNNNYLITANHNLYKSNKINVVSNGETIKIDKDYHVSDSEYDLTIIKVDNDIETLDLYNKSKSIRYLFDKKLKGNKNYLYGFSEQWGFKRIEATVSKIVYNADNGNKSLLYNTKGDYGMSGGPVLDEYGKVVGYIIAKIEMNENIVNKDGLLIKPVDNIHKLIDKIEGK